MVDESVDDVFEQELQKNYDFIRENAKADPDLAPFADIEDFSKITSESLYKFHQDLLEAVETRTYGDDTKAPEYDVNKLNCIYAIAMEHGHKEKQDLSTNALELNEATASDTHTETGNAEQVLEEEHLQEMYAFIRRQSKIDPDLVAFARVPDFSKIPSPDLHLFCDKLHEAIKGRNYNGDLKHADYDELKLSVIAQVAQEHERREQKNAHDPSPTTLPDVADGPIRTFFKKAVHCFVSKPFRFIKETFNKVHVIPTISDELEECYQFVTELSLRDNAFRALANIDDIRTMSYKDLNVVCQDVEKTIKARKQEFGYYESDSLLRFDLAKLEAIQKITEFHKERDKAITKRERAKVILVVAPPCVAIAAVCALALPQSNLMVTGGRQQRDVNALLAYKAMSLTASEVTAASKKYDRAPNLIKDWNISSAHYGIQISENKDSPFFHVKHIDQEKLPSTIDGSPQATWEEGFEACQLMKLKEDNKNNRKTIETLIGSQISEGSQLYKMQCVSSMRYGDKAVVGKHQSSVRESTTARSGPAYNTTYAEGVVTVGKDQQVVTHALIYEHKSSWNVLQRLRGKDEKLLKEVKKYTGETPQP